MSSLEFAARHTCDSPEWYTPTPFVEAAREVMGAIDLDPASHEEANQTVKAARFFTAEDDGLKQSWSGRVFLNPPGGKSTNGDSLVASFWMKLLYEYVEDFHRADQAVHEAIWIGYSLEQLQTLQNYPVRTPLAFPMCVPSRRIAFVENAAKKAARIEAMIAAGKKPNDKSQPSHANYISYLGPNTGAFKRVFSRLGEVR